MAINLAGLGVIFNANSTQNQQLFQLNAVPGSFTKVYVNGVLLRPTEYAINGSVISMNSPMPEGQWIYVISGQGGTFVPQSYVDDAVAPKEDTTSVNTKLADKMNKSGGVFTGPIEVPTPINPTHPVTLEMFQNLGDVVSPTDLTNAVSPKADQTWVQTQLDDKISNDLLGSQEGVAELDENSEILTYQLPQSVFSDDKSFSKFGPLAVGMGQGRWYPRYSGIIKGIVGYVEQPAEGSDLKIDINKGTGSGAASSIFPGSTRLTIPAGQNFAEYVFPSSPTFARGDYIVLEIEQVGSTTTGQTLSCQIEYTYTP